jgi:hypothetical protein
MSPELATHGEGQQPGGSVHAFLSVSTIFDNSHSVKTNHAGVTDSHFSVQCYNHSKQY